MTLTFKSIIQSAVNDFDECVTRIREEILRYLSLELKRLGIDSISWNQYTPYFNDGDECVFRSQLLYPTIRIKDQVIEECSFSTCDTKLNMNGELRNLGLTLNLIDNDLLEILFGDHKRIVVNQSGFTITDFADHE